MLFLKGSWVGWIFLESLGGDDKTVCGVIFLGGRKQGLHGKTGICGYFASHLTFFERTGKQVPGAILVEKFLPGFDALPEGLGFAWGDQIVKPKVYRPVYNWRGREGVVFHGWQ